MSGLRPSKSGLNVAGGGDDFHLGIFGLDGIVKEREALLVFLAALLVSDADEFQMEWSGVTVFGAEFPPGGTDGTVGVFEGVEGVLHPGPHAVEERRLDVRRAGVDAEDGLGAEVLGHLQVFVKAEPPGAAVALPDVEVGAALLDRADGVFPRPAAGGGRAGVDERTAGETEEGRTGFIQQLHEIGAQAVGAVFPGVFRKKGNHAEPDAAW